MAYYNPLILERNLPEMEKILAATERATRPQ